MEAAYVPVNRETFPYGQINWAMPETFLVIAFICEIAMLGSAGAVASTVAMPTKPLHCATPLPSIVGVAAMVAMLDMPTGIGVANGLPMLQCTAGDIIDMGAILNVALAMN